MNLFIEPESNLKSSNLVQKALDKLWIHNGSCPSFIFHNGLPVVTPHDHSIEIKANEATIILHENHLNDPIFLIHIVDENNTKSDFSTHITVKKERQISLIECHISEGKTNLSYTQKTHLYCEPLTHIRHFILKQGRGQHQHTAHIEQAEQSDYQAIHLAVENSKTLAEVRIDLNGKNAKTEFHTLQLPRNKEIVDIDLTIHHHESHCQSHSMARTVLNDAARGKMYCKIVVHPNAKGSLAHFESKNLLLSEHGEVSTKPEFEIYHDDVCCTHGATVGYLDQNALFYLRSRGLTETEAKRLLIKAFIQPILNKLSLPNLPLFIERLEGLLDGAIDGASHQDIEHE